LFRSHPLTSELVVAAARAEHVTPLPVAPERAGRNHDLLALGMARGRRVVIGIEGKAAEPFGPEVGPYRREAKARNERLPVDHDTLVTDTRRSMIPERIDTRAALIFGTEVPVELDSAPYQLLHGVAATLLEGASRDADLAVFLVHQFAGESIDQARVVANTNALEGFVRMLLPSLKESFRPGRLYGPIPSAVQIRGGHGIRLLVGEVLTVLA